MASLIIDLLAERDDAELEKMEQKAERELRRLQVELEQVQEARARKARRSSRSGSRGGPGSTRQRVLDAIQSREGGVTPVEIMGALAQEGEVPARGAIYNMLTRLVREDELTRLGGGRYELASRASPVADPPELPSEPTENGSEGQLSAGISPQETARQDA